MNDQHTSTQAEPWILGFDVGGTKTALLAGTLQGKIINRTCFATEAARGFPPVWDDMVAAAEGLIAQHGAPLAIGVSIGGPLDTEHGIIYSPPNLPGWDAIPLKSLLEEQFAVPAYVEHDAKACALAEWIFGAAQGLQHVVFLTFGTGLGAGVILNNALYRGACDITGEVGHWRIAADGPLIYGKRGSWEGFSSGSGISALAQWRYPEAFDRATTAADVINKARAGDEQALAVVNESATYLGHGMALLIDLLNPQMIVLGSLAVRAGDLFLPVARAVVAEEALPVSASYCQIVPAGLGEAIGDIAPICAAIYRGGFRVGTAGETAA